MYITDNKRLSVSLNLPMFDPNQTDIYKERPFSSSKTRKDIIIKNSVLTKPEFSTFTKNKNSL